MELEKQLHQVKEEMKEKEILLQICESKSVSNITNT